MKPFAKTFDRIGTENAFAIGPKISALEKEGYNIVRVNIGEPSCNITKEAARAMIESVNNHETHYCASAGIDSLRTTLAEYLTVTRKVNYKAEDVIMAPGENR